ncbi:hypothetical protein NHX12_019929, partial [Muraenolepis orangiensis]
TANGNVEAKVVCFYRRRDISSTLIALADKHAHAPSGVVLCLWYPGELEDEMESPEMADLPAKHKHQLRHRELFLSRQLESLPATHIRGKCCVTLLNETEALKSYLDREPFADAFFYSLVYDPQQKTLLADKGEIRVGNKYQADVTDLMKEGEEDGRELSKMEERIWLPSSNLTEKQIDQFLVFHAMDTLHGGGYDMTRAIAALVPQGGPVLCRDEMEEWSASEANLFEEALEKYGKDFTDIQQDFLPWKSLTSIIEYYYMWKTTDRYVQQVMLEQGRAWSRGSPPSRDRDSPPPRDRRLASHRPPFWAGPARAATSPHGLPLRHSGSPKFAVKTRQAFFLQTTGLTRAARRLCLDIIRPRYLARHPYLPVNTAAVKSEYKPKDAAKRADRKPLEDVVRYLEAHPRPVKAGPPRGSSIASASLTPIKSSPILNNGSPTILGKRSYEQHNGMDGGKSKGLAPQWDIMAKRISEPTRPSVHMRDEVHELD